MMVRIQLRTLSASLHLDRRRIASERRCLPPLTPAFASSDLLRQVSLHHPWQDTGLPVCRPPYYSRSRALLRLLTNRNLVPVPSKSKDRTQLRWGFPWATKICRKYLRRCLQCLSCHQEAHSAILCTSSLRHTPSLNQGIKLWRIDYPCRRLSGRHEHPWGFNVLFRFSPFGSVLSCPIVLVTIETLKDKPLSN
jgi:hypothetical protein